MMLRLVAILLSFIFPVIVFAANGTTVGALTVTVTLESIGYSCAFTEDDNTNMTATVEYKLSSDGSWTTIASTSTKPPAYIDRRATVRSAGANVGNPYEKTVRGSFIGLSRNTSYDVRVTFSDTDGITGTNPVTVSNTSTWGHDEPSYGVCSESVANDGELTSALTTCAGSGGTITLSNGNYSGKTITEDGGGISTFLKLIAANSQEAHFTGELILNNADYIHLENLDFDAGIEVTGGSTYCLIEGNSLDGQGIRLDGDVTGLIIQDNTMDNVDSNTGDQYDAAIYAKSSMTGGGVCRRNTIDRANDGIGGEGNSSLNAGFNNWDFYENEIIRGDDDHIEVEGGSVNTRIWSNFFHIRGDSGYNRGNAIAINPCVIGPLYVFNNLAVDVYNGFKIGTVGGGGGNADGQAYIINNTIVDCSANGINQSDSDGQKNIYLKNNIFSEVSSYYIYSHDTGATGWIIDKNCYYDSGSPSWRYSSTNTNVWATWQASGNDANSFNTDPLLNASYESISGASPVVDTGESIIVFGFDKDDSSRPVGAAWDIGAYEYGDPGNISIPGNLTGTIQ